MHPDSQTRELRVGGWLPGQRGESDSDDPNWALSQETMLLPAFLTGTPAEVVKAADAIVSEPATPAAARRRPRQAAAVRAQHADLRGAAARDRHAGHPGDGDGLTDRDGLAPTPRASETAAAQPSQPGLTSPDS